MIDAVTVSFRDETDGLREQVEDHITQLAERYGPFRSGHVSVSAPHQHHRKGSLYRGVIELSGRAGDIAVGREHHDDHKHEDATIALRDAFAAARRQFETLAKRQLRDRRRV